MRSLGGCIKHNSLHERDWCTTLCQLHVIWRGSVIKMAKRTAGTHAYAVYWFGFTCYVCIFHCDAGLVRTWLQWRWSIQQVLTSGPSGRHSWPGMVILTTTHCYCKLSDVIVIYCMWCCEMSAVCRGCILRTLASQIGRVLTLREPGVRRWIKNGRG